MPGRRAWALGLAAAVVVGAAACGGSAGAGGGKVRLSLVAYSTPQAAYEAVIREYQKTPEGKDVTFTKSYGSSGEQSRAVASGLRADVVALSLEPDMTRLSLQTFAGGKGDVLLAYENEAGAEVHVRPSVRAATVPASWSP